MAELYLLLDVTRKEQHRQNKFLAALEGVDLDENTEQSSFEETKKKAAAALAGQTEEQYTFNMIGIEMEPDDE